MALGTVVSFLQLLCAMGLLSSIIIWLSLEFEPGKLSRRYELVTCAQ